MLKQAGWFPGRKVDVSDVIKYYENRNIKLSDKAIHFFEEYYGIEDYWDILYTWSINGENKENIEEIFVFTYFRIQNNIELMLEI